MSAKFPRGGGSRTFFSSKSIKHTSGIGSCQFYGGKSVFIFLSATHLFSPSIGTLGSEKSHPLDSTLQIVENRKKY